MDGEGKGKWGEGEGMRYSQGLSEGRALLSASDVQVL